MSLRDHDKRLPTKSEKAMPSILISDDKLKTALVMRWFSAAEHCGLGVGTAQ